jgi:hypothetical protein
VRVEEQDKLRLLTIDNIVQNAVRAEKTQTQVNPIVELVARVQPKTRSTLLVELGTGNTTRTILTK